jgi:beta-ribofuranosylaminobenzene 5'-phosphate synthase
VSADEKPRAPVFIEAPARLHFGVLDLAGRLGRRFGGMGAAVPQPSLLLEASRADRLEAVGEEAERVLGFARRFVSQYSEVRGARLQLHRAIPAHAGLGSGTQLGLAVGRALAELYGIETEPATLARSVGRGLRSAIGTWVFSRGGFILEGGRRPGRSEVAPLLAHYTLPPSWRCVVVVPPGAPGLSGEAEATAFRTLPPPPDREVERVAHLVLMQLLPALVEAELPAFGAALTEVQRITGGWFAGSQGGIFAPGPTAALVELMARSGAPGVGQSSWGPTAYALADGDEAAERVAAAARRFLGGRGAVYTVPFAAQGARVGGGTGGVQAKG